MLGSTPMDVLVRAPAFLLGLGLHEWAHAWVADRAGDPTPRSQGRVTLNPLAHLDPLGTLCILFAPIGWGKPVQVDPRHFRTPGRDWMRVALAGPLTNVVLLAAGLLLLDLAVMAGAQQGSLIVGVLFWVILLNLALALFNMVPVPPLDGSKVARHLLGERGVWIDKLRPYGMLVILLLVTQGAFGPVVEWGFLAVGMISAFGLPAEIGFLLLAVFAWLWNAEALPWSRPAVMPPDLAQRLFRRRPD